MTDTETNLEAQSTSQQVNKEKEANLALVTMVKFAEKSREQELKGNNPLGFWIGPEASTYNEHNHLKPVFIFSQPVETKMPHTWEEDAPDENSENYDRFKRSGHSFQDYQRINQDNPNLLVPLVRKEREAYIVQHTYLILTPDGPIGIKFNKRLVNEDGSLHERHSGPGGNRELEYDDIEGGEDGTFLPRIYEIFDQENKGRTWSGTDFTPVGITREVGTDRLVLKLGSGQMHHAVYSEAVTAGDHRTPDTNVKDSWWGLVRVIDDKTMREAVKNSAEFSHREREKIIVEINKEENRRKIELMNELLSQA